MVQGRVGKGTDMVRAWPPCTAGAETFMETFPLVLSSPVLSSDPHPHPSLHAAQVLLGEKLRFEPGQGKSRVRARA